MVVGEFASASKPLTSKGSEMNTWVQGWGDGQNSKHSMLLGDAIMWCPEKIMMMANDSTHIPMQTNGQNFELASSSPLVRSKYRMASQGIR